MRDLRRRALESHKTVSRKARSSLNSAQSSAATSQNNSRAGSRAHSRNPSRQVSDDEEYGSDSTGWGANSIDDMLNAEDTDAAPDSWKTELDDRMEELINRKRSTVEGREKCLAIYTNILLHSWAKNEIESKTKELHPAIWKSIKEAHSDKETILALKALSTTLITCPDDQLFDGLEKPLKGVIQDAESIPVKVAAISTLTTVTSFGGAGDDSIRDVMDYLVEICESDGHSVEAPDEGDVVAAALEEWGFLATQLDDTQDVAETAMEAFVEQLEAANAAVQIAAGENIALLYENSYTELEEDEEFPADQTLDPDDEEDSSAPKMVKRYSVYRREDQLKHTLQGLANVSGRGISKKDKKALHTNFADILNSVEHPARGPRYSNAIDQETNKRYGSRLTVKIPPLGAMRIDTWHKLHRLNSLRRRLQSGFTTHYLQNEVVSEAVRD